MAASSNRLRLDRSKPFATIHGGRHPGDPHLLAKFQQDGIHYDAQGLHIPELLTDDKVKKLVDVRLKRQIKSAPKADGADEIDDNDPGEDSPGSSDDVNLEAWLRGEAKYEWFLILKTIRERFKVNLSKQVDVVEFLVTEQKIIPLDEVDPDLSVALNKNR